MTDPTIRSIHRTAWRDRVVSEGSRAVPEETAIALTYNGGTYAVMMGSPQDLGDFAIGFGLAEGVIRSPADILSLDIVEIDGGIELRMWLDETRAGQLSERRRHMAGPTGCGLCGIESVAEALRIPGAVGKGRTFSAEQIVAAIQSMGPLQQINMQTRAVHAAAFWTPERGIVALREDVGRHNALDKLAGALAQLKLDAADGAVLLTSRVSVEMVQKAAVIGVPLIVAVSAPTALAIRMAEQAGITLAAVARADGFEIFTHPARIRTAGAEGPSEHVA